MKWLAQQVQHIKQPIEFVLKHVKSIPKLIAAIFLDCLIFCPRRKLNLIGLFLGFQIVTVLAQPSAMLHFDAVSSENGLSENTIRKIYQDSRGYIWVATQDGLNRYDGFTFTVYNHQPENPNSISDNFINEITEDRHGNIWVITSRATCLLAMKRKACTVLMCCVSRKIRSAGYGLERMVAGSII